MDKPFRWCDRLTISLNAAIFELSLKLHAIVSTEHSRALKLPMCKLSFVPDMVKRQWGCHFF